MFKYYVTLIHNYKGMDEQTMFKTNDLEKAKEEARYFAEGCSKHYYVELRTYTHDIEDEDYSCFDYNTIKYEKED